MSRDPHPNEPEWVHRNRLHEAQQTVRFTDADRVAALNVMLTAERAEVARLRALLDEARQLVPKWEKHKREYLGMDDYAYTAYGNALGECACELHAVLGVDLTLGGEHEPGR